ncbi:MAG TPA: H-NS family nucleoid-associated regulatory protein [Ideonella sp.]|nr:H-NS family nucleoid-associated regulatory protein [Ideonella sp.]
MATTYIQLARQIESLKAQAEQVKKKEIAGVVASIKEAIAVYALTAEELGFGGKTGSPVTAASKKAKARTQPAGKRAKNRASVAYGDAAGHTWGGRGPRPVWLKAALAAGQSLESLAVGAAAAADAVAPAASAPVEAVVATGRKVRPKAVKVEKVPKAPSPAKYKDDAGHAWSGRGPKPAWFKHALAGGKTLEELAA